MGFVRSRDGRHQALYIDPAGKRRSAGTFSSVRKAEEAILRKEVAKANGDWVDPREGTVTFATFAQDRWLPHRRVRDSTRGALAGHLRNHLVPSFGQVAMADLAPEHVQALVTAMLQRGLAPSTIRNVHATLHSCLDKAVREKVIAHNPSDGTELPKAGEPSFQILTPEQADQLLAAIRPEVRTLLLVLQETGMRWGESQALTPDDVDVGKSMLRVSANLIEVAKTKAPSGFRIGPTKTGKNRQVKVSREVTGALVERMQEQSLGGTDLLLGRSGVQPHQRTTFHKGFWNPARTAIGLPALRVHDLRHTHATWLLEGNASLAVVMERLGHGSIATTQRYLHTMPDSHDVALEALARVRGKS